MMKDARFQTSLCVPLTAAALSLILAACGGGGSNNSTRAVSSSPSANTPSTANVPAGTSPIADAINIGTINITGNTGDAGSSSGNSSSGTTGAGSTGSASGSTGSTGTGTNNSNANGSSASSGTGSTAGNASTGNASGSTSTNTGANTGTATNPATPATPAVAPLVSVKGVRGDVLLAMFDQQACRGEFDMNRDGAVTGASPNVSVEKNTPPVYAMTALSAHPYTYDYDKWRAHGSNPPARAPLYVMNCSYPDIRSYSNPVQPGSYTYKTETAGRYHTYLTSRYYGDPSITRGVNEATTTYPLTVTADAITVGSDVKVELEEDFGYKATDISASDVPKGRELDLALTGTARTYQRQGVVPFGAVNRWQDGAGNNLELLLIKADEANTVRLCTHLNSVLAKRLHCVTWEVPADWVWGKELKGGSHYLIDDRSVYAGETGFFYWR